MKHQLDFEKPIIELQSKLDDLRKQPQTRSLDVNFVEEIKLIESHLKIKLTRGTLGMGLPYIGSSILMNSHGFIVSDHSSGIEISDADQALGYID